jgi:FG-GAP-like repeat
MMEGNRDMKTTSHLKSTITPAVRGSIRYRSLRRVFLLVFIAIIHIVVPPIAYAGIILCDFYPTAGATTTNVTVAGGTLYSFTVQYTATTPGAVIDVSTLDNQDVRIVGPSGFNSATRFVSVNVNTNGTPRIATYSFVPPGGSWDSTDNGTYSIVMQDNEVFELFGCSVPGPVSIGSFTVTIGWQISALGDFNHDGKPDYLLYNASTRRTAVWYMNNNVFLGGAYGPTLPAGWNVVDVADFNGDGNLDYALFNPSTRQTAIWYLSGVTFLGGHFGPTLPSGWALVATADFNGDGKPDYVLYNAGAFFLGESTHRTAVWYVNNNVFVSGAYGPTLPAGWSLAGVADFNGDGQRDYLLFNASTRQSAIWYLSGVTFVGAAYGPMIASGYELEGTADFNGDGKSDYLLFSLSTRRTAIWYLNNNIFIGGAYGPTLPF